jgi:tetratricopeptide (TPR) repeat protein
LELERRWGDDRGVAHTLRHLSQANRFLNLHEEGIRQAKEALEMFERAGKTTGQMQCLDILAWLYLDGEQLEAAENTTSHAIDLSTEKDQAYLVCDFHRILGMVHRYKGEKKQAIHHFETALGIASPPNWHEELFWIYHAFAELFCKEGEFDDANTHIERAKSHVLNDAYKLGRTMQMQAFIRHLQQRPEDAKLKALHALEIYEKLGAEKDAEDCRNLLRKVELAIVGRSADPQGEPLEKTLYYPV